MCPKVWATSIRLVALLVLSLLWTRSSQLQQIKCTWYFFLNITLLWYGIASVFVRQYPHPTEVHDCYLNVVGHDSLKGKEELHSFRYEDCPLVSLNSLDYGSKSRNTHWVKMHRFFLENGMKCPRVSRVQIDTAKMHC